MEKVLIETYADLVKRGVMFFCGNYGFDSKADACTIKIGDACGIFYDIGIIQSERQEKVATVHEWAHITQNATYHVDAPPAIKQKAETKAHRAEIKKLVPVNRLRRALKGGITQIYELSEYFNVPEDIIRDALEYYQGPCGMTFQ